MPYNNLKEMMRMAEHPEGLDAGDLRIVGKREPKVDAVKLVLGKPAYTDDIELRGLLHAKILTSPHAHARIKRIDTTKAKALPGVHAVLTHEDLPPVRYTTAGQSHPEPSPADTRSLDNKVRFVGDRVAAVAAESLDIANRALALIEVEYEVLPAILNMEDALKPGAPIIHDEADIQGAKDPKRNLAAHIEAHCGDLAQGFEAADMVLEHEYRVPQVQQTPLETHVCITWWDEDDRLVVRTSTQVPFHVRRIIAPVIGLPSKRIRVIKPRIGGGFGGKQEVLIEDICAHLTIATGRPVRLEYTRTEEFVSARSRHPQILKLKAGVRRDGTLTALDLNVLADTGAYGAHALTVQGNTASKGLAVYRCANMRFYCDVVYTNKPVPGAFRGYGAPQGFFAIESMMDELADGIGLDPAEIRRRNWVQIGDLFPLAAQLGEGREGFENPILSCGLPQCLDLATEAIGWQEKRAHGDPQKASVPGKPHLRRGVGLACVTHGTAIPGLDMGGTYIKMNDDGSFNLLFGGTDLGTGADTVLAQIAAEVLGCRLSDIIVYAADTDMTPFDKGAYASSTTFISGGSVKKASEDIARQIKDVAGRIMEENATLLSLHDGRVWAPSGESVTLEQVALHSLHLEDQHQIMATASHMSYKSPPPFACQTVEVEVDIQTGEVHVQKMVMAVDCGRVINPATAEGQVEGGMTQALGYGLCEEMIYDDEGQMVNARFGDYKILQADEMPKLEVFFVQTDEPTGPFGAKAVAEIPLDGVHPALANAIADATGVRIRQIPLTPERVWRALQLAAII